MHRCALCSGRGHRFIKRAATRHLPPRPEPCCRCRGIGQHGDRKVKSKPLAATEIDGAERPVVVLPSCQHNHIYSDHYSTFAKGTAPVFKCAKCGEVVP